MDTVILAAGANVRLQAAGIPPGKKPLIFRDGEVLIRRLCRQARIDHSTHSRVVIVANPSNAEDVAYATNMYHPHIILQLNPIGPTHALDLALELVTSDEILLLMADNYIKQWLPVATVPCVGTTLSNDPALHPINGEGFFTRDQSTLVRWLGPLAFHRDMYTPGAPSWIEAFDNISFDIVQHPPGNVEDMGVIK